MNITNFTEDEILIFMKDFMSLETDNNLTPEKTLITFLFQEQYKLYEQYVSVENLPILPEQLKEKTVDYNRYDVQRIIKEFIYRGIEEIAGETMMAIEDNDKDHIGEEIGDSLHFLTECMILSGVTADDINLVRDDNLPMYCFHPDNWAYTAGRIAIEFTRAANVLKNKPWKTSQVRLDEVKFRQRIIAAFEFYLAELMRYKTPEELYLDYIRKSKINKFRIESKY